MPMAVPKISTEPVVAPAAQLTCALPDLYYYIVTVVMLHVLCVTQDDIS